MFFSTTRNVLTARRLGLRQSDASVAAAATGSSGAPLRRSSDTGTPATCPPSPLAFSSVQTPATAWSAPLSVDIIYGGKGNDTLFGGSGSDTFVVRKGEGSDIIEDFQAGIGGDALRLQNYGFADFWAFKAVSVQSGADVRVSLPDGATLVLRNVDLTALVADNIVVDWRLPWSGTPTTWSATSTSGATLAGTAGNDQLTAHASDITLSGGAGDDTYFVWDHTDKVVEATAGGIDTIKTYGLHGYSLTTSPEVENLVLLGHAVVLGARQRPRQCRQRQ